MSAVVSAEQTVRPARYSFPDLCHVEALADAAAQSAYYLCTVMPDRPEWPESQRRFALSQGLHDELRAEERKVRHVLCLKCGGRGRIVQYTHRSGGRCYSCEGFGCKKAFRTALIEGRLLEASRVAPKARRVPQMITLAKEEEQCH